MSNIRFLKHKVVNDTTKQSARVWYSLDNRIDGRKCVTIYAKDYGSQLSRVFDSDEVTNRTDTQTDYFDKDSVRLFEDHPLYKIARKHVEQMNGIFKEEPKQVIVEPDVDSPEYIYSELMRRLGVTTSTN